MECAFCHKKFDPKSKIHKFCSRLCRRKDESKARSKKPKVKTCKLCGEIFKPYTSLDKFCSANCRVKNKKSKRIRNWNNDSCKNRMGKKNPAYRNGTRTKGRFYSSKHLRANSKYRKAFLEKNGYIFCEHCEVNQSLKFETHHIIFASEAPKHPNLHNHRNQILLCIKCHNEFHKYKSKRDYLIKERGLSELFPELKNLTKTFIINF